MIFERSGNRCGGRSSKVYLIGLYPTEAQTQRDRELYEATFRAISIVYDVNFQIAQHPEELMGLKSIPHVSLEMPNQHTQALETFEHPEEAVYVVGNSQYWAPAHQLARVDHRIHVPTPELPTPGPEKTLYGFQILPIVLQDRYAKI